MNSTKKDIRAVNDLLDCLDEERDSKKVLEKLITYYIPRFPRILNNSDDAAAFLLGWRHYQYGDENFVKYSKSYKNSYDILSYNEQIAELYQTDKLCGADEGCSFLGWYSRCTYRLGYINYIDLHRGRITKKTFKRNLDSLSTDWTGKPLSGGDMYMIGFQRAKYKMQELSHTAKKDN